MTVIAASPEVRTVPFPSLLFFSGVGFGFVLVFFFFFFVVFFSGIAPHERGKELEGKEAKQSKAKQSSHESWTDVVLPVASRVLIDR